MESLTFIEFLGVTGIIMQCLVVFISLLALGYVPDRGTWIYFFIGISLISIRRLVAVYRITGGYDTGIVESIIGIVVSICFIIYIIKRGMFLKKKRGFVKE